VGRQAAQQQGEAFPSSSQFAGTPSWSPTLWSRRIDIDLNAQQLVAYEGDMPVFRAPVATGKDGFNTPAGSFAIYSKYPMETMAGSAGGETWYVPDIPWVQYVVGGVALHGTYWHDQWGTGVRMSHGCINLNIDDAQWLYEWADVGTQVDIHY
ncbi:MAG TPA: L,D-transpeptidase, partial [Roseiflexaceae bacterium]|nr:L,D-transpeptidase [Roseiflexaceae bacterium]